MTALPKMAAGRGILGRKLEEILGAGGIRLMLGAHGVQLELGTP